MREIAANIYIEEKYPGVVLGAILKPQGLLYIDAPPAPEDVRDWRAALMGLSKAPERLLINLDAHPDRTLGVRGMECPVVAHEKISVVFRSRSGASKASSEETGAEWEEVVSFGTVRWASPELTFSHQMSIHWGGAPVLLEYHPGPALGASWVILPEAQVVFVGDAVVFEQPPFLAQADLPQWLESLNLLLTPAYQGWKIVSGRNGLVTTEQVQWQIELLKKIQARLEKIKANKSPIDALDKLANALLEELGTVGPRQQQYSQRLRYGLRQYYNRRIHATGRTLEEE
ncbi:MAG: hypothetical protein RML93_06955 [Anaerolineales bacterium]|nr:hypothetical protein [Anaerolineales bacterium]MCX7609872.1 hypothetical protein [Anaerolineales bacterium]MDW8227160.1 hypothetical protein [Anaerolineales bacterium]MDW8447011.1 hypothetical protein [Anaerolineales bacterium]